MVWHHSLLLMNSFNKTEAAVFSCRLCFLRAFPFISLISCYCFLVNQLNHKIENTRTQNHYQMTYESNVFPLTERFHFDVNIIWIFSILNPNILRRSRSFTTTYYKYCIATGVIWGVTLWC